LSSLTLKHFRVSLLVMPLNLMPLESLTKSLLVLLKFLTWDSTRMTAPVWSKVVFVM
jgi:hypothetical protein